MLSTKHLCAASLQPISLKSLEGKLVQSSNVYSYFESNTHEIYRLTGKSLLPQATFY
ncbi:hypothetical protein BANRA_05379 [Escherichia coli]|nr:hypothetical protein BANRA_05379 [Escherichia coli]